MCIMINLLLSLVLFGPAAKRVNAVYLHLYAASELSECGRETRLFANRRGGFGSQASCLTRQAGSLPAESGWKPDFRFCRTAQERCGEILETACPQAVF